MEIRQSLEENFLTCKYCHQAYRRPKVLLCLHTFCQACLEQLVAQKDAELESKELEEAKRYYAASNSSSDYKSGYRKKWSSKFRYGGYESSNVSTYGIPRFSFSNGKTDRISCPLCDKDTAIPPGGVSELPTDQLADRLASMVDRMPTFPVCDVCTRKPLLEDKSLPANGQNGRESDKHSNSESSDESDQEKFHNKNKTKQKTTSSSACKTKHEINGPQPAIAACLECSKRLCASCRDSHTKMPVTSHHVLVRVEQMDDIRCSRHPREIRKLFCLTCRENVCIVCTFDQSEHSNGGGHRDHEIMSIRDAVTSYQEELNRESATTQAHVDQIDTLLNRLQCCEDEMRTIYKSIDAGAKQFIEQLSQQQHCLKHRVDELAGVSLDVLSNECQRLNQTSNDWYEFLNDDRVTSRLDLMDPLEALAEAGPLLDRVRNCLQSASQPLNRELARQSFLSHLKTAESSALTNGDSGITSSQSSASPGTNEDQRAIYWRKALGQYIPGTVNLGRVATEKELAAEAIVDQARIVHTCAQTGPELIKTLPPPKGSQRHRAVQIDTNSKNVVEHAVQTDSPLVANMPAKVNKSDVGTQYVSADVNPPISMYRSLKQILVQK